MVEVEFMVVEPFTYWKDKFDPALVPLVGDCVCIRFENCCSCHHEFEVTKRHFVYGNPDDSLQLIHLSIEKTDERCCDECPFGSLDKVLAGIR